MQAQSEEPKTDEQLAKEAKKAEKAAAKAAAKAAKEEEKLRREEERKAAELAKMGPSLTLDSMETSMFGNLFIQSHRKTGRVWTSVGELTKEKKDATVWIRCRIQATRKQSKLCFIEFRDGMFTVQGVASGDALGFATTLTSESVVDVEAKVEIPPAPIKSCTQGEVELQILRLYCISRASPLPFLIEDAARSEKDLEKDATLVRVNQDVRLDNRVIDLRTAANQAIFRIQSGVCTLFREFLLQQNFVEIHTPKLIGAASEGGANVFKMKYFDRDAYLAQSPQLYKQMALMSDLPRVFEVAPVFRAEDSFTHRHMTEFMGLDMEMHFKDHYHEVLDVLDGLFDYIFTGLNERFSVEIESVRRQYPFEDLKWRRNGCLRMTFVEAIRLLKEDGPPVLQEKLKQATAENNDFFVKKYESHLAAIAAKEPTEDLTTEDERILGEVIHRKMETDFYIIDKFPTSVRPFYTMEDPEDPTWCNAYDLFIRGEEITSGAQRIHCPTMLMAKAEKMGIETNTIQPYVDSFKFGAFPHAGGGIGLERVVMLFLNLNNIRKTSMFPRDPKRITP